MDTTAVTSPPPTTVTPPKPRRRRRWLIVLGCLLAFVAAPVAYYFVDAWFANSALERIYAEIDAEDPNWRWNDLIAEIKVPPDDENSVVQVRKVQDLLKKKPFLPGPKWDNGPRNFLDVRNSRLSPEYEKILVSALAALDPDTLTEARKLKDLPNGAMAIPAVDNPFLDIKLDYVQESRAVVYVLDADAIHRGQSGDFDGAAESCMAILNTARSFKDQPFLISALVRNAEQAIAVGGIERTLAQGEVSDANLQKLQNLLEREYADDTLYAAMRGERAAGQQMAEMMRQRKMKFSQLTSNTGGGANGAGMVVDFFPGLILGSFPDYIQVMNEQVKAAKLQDPERGEAFRVIEEKVKKKRTILASMILPATMKVGQASQRLQSSLRCAAAGVAVERFRTKNDRWPNGLDELVKTGYLKEIPTDPYDGKSLRFKRTPTGAIVYSVGPNKIDDGGTLNRSNLMAPSIDHGFELWLPSMRGVPPIFVDKD
jgi:hypothetical protein